MNEHAHYMFLEMGHIVDEDLTINTNLEVQSRESDMYFCLQNHWDVNFDRGCQEYSLYIRKLPNGLALF